jgi:hypothetical protein
VRLIPCRQLASSQGNQPAWRRSSWSHTPAPSRIAGSSSSPSPAPGGASPRVAPSLQSSTGARESMTSSVAERASEPVTFKGRTYNGRRFRTGKGGGAFFIDDWTGSKGDQPPMEAVLKQGMETEEATNAMHVRQLLSYDENTKTGVLRKIPGTLFHRTSAFRHIRQALDEADAKEKEILGPKQFHELRKKCLKLIEPSTIQTQASRQELRESALVRRSIVC